MRHVQHRVAILREPRLSVWDRDPDKVLAYHNATAIERAAVELAAAQMLAFEVASRPVAGTAAATLDRLGVPMDRWCLLAVATIYRAEQMRGRPCSLECVRRKNKRGAAYRAARRRAA